MNIVKLKARLWDEKKRLEERIEFKLSIQETSSLQGSLMTIEKIIMWCNK